MILVTGGTGKVGRALVLELSLKKAAAKVLVRTARAAREVEALGLEAAYGDLTDGAAIAAALRGVDTVFLLTPPTQNEADLKGAVIEAAKLAGARHVVLLSGAGASQASRISQAQQHAHSEVRLKSSGLAFTILRPYYFMQNLLGQADAIRATGAVFGNYRDGRIAMVDTRDVAAVAAVCLTEVGHEGRTYLVTGGEAITQTQVAQKLSTALRRSIAYIDLPSAEFVQGMIGAGYPEWLANDLAKLGEECAGGRFAQTTDAVETVGKKQPITFDRFAKDNAQAFSDRDTGRVSRERKPVGRREWGRRAREPRSRGLVSRAS